VAQANKVILTDTKEEVLPENSKQVAKYMKKMWKSRNILGLKFKKSVLKIIKRIKSMRNIWLNKLAIKNVMKDLQIKRMTLMISDKYSLKTQYYFKNSNIILKIQNLFYN
jgi:3-hydroxyacyl-CoA dehydrogenase